jgi:hypothetical protein
VVGAAGSHAQGFNEGDRCLHPTTTIKLGACKDFTVMVASTAACAGALNCDIKIVISRMENLVSLLTLQSQATLMRTLNQRRTVLPAPQMDWPPERQELN